ncbi:MAG: UvrD-helicase domain-containing protein [Spirochaetales bacterium]|nr:UvrD-helicase domain-containing protein [Spirochaetales bacterium]
MKFIADLHIHSPYSRGTSKNAHLPELFRWARLKGIHVLGTGDFTHPRWIEEIESLLETDGSGLFSLKNPPGEQVFEGVDPSPLPIKYLLQTEISSIYKKNGKTRKIHTLVFAPGIQEAKRISAKFAAIGNITSDGRPILGLDAKRLLEMVLEVSPGCHVVPAHIWTPWFSLFGANSGFDSIEECFEDLTPYIFALETGLSSDPVMNWRISALDRYTLISNSDSHSASKIGREANVFSTELSYDGIFSALKTREGFEGTIEFFPEEGKYHYDGHRKCNVVLTPEEAIKNKDLCPVCGKKLTIGTFHRVLELADRKHGKQPCGQKGFTYAIPLNEMISEIVGTGPSTKGVMTLYAKAIAQAGNEHTLLFESPFEDIQKVHPLLAVAVSRLREGTVITRPGYDGEYGVIRLFSPGEMESLAGQKDLIAPFHNKKKTAPAQLFKTLSGKKKPALIQPETPALSEEQQDIVDYTEKPIAVSAGPGTGKTRTLTQWIANCVKTKAVPPESILAITFTNRAAEELKERLYQLLGKKAEKLNIGTFHSLCFDIIKKWYPNVRSIYDEAGRTSIIHYLYPENTPASNTRLSQEIEAFLDGTLASGDPEVETAAIKYQDILKSIHGIDVAALINEVNLIFESRREILEYYRNLFIAIAVDEFQDINPTQYSFLSHLAGPALKRTDSDPSARRLLFVIGDPNQSIYGFRGSDVSLFSRFQKEYQTYNASLGKNYRSDANICNAAGALISRNTRKSSEGLIPVLPEKKPVIVISAPDETAEAEYIARKVKELVGGIDMLSAPSEELDSSYSFRDIAVMVRTHRAAEAVIALFEKHGIPASIRRARAPLRMPPYTTIADILRFFINRQDVVAYRNIVARFIPELSGKQLDMLFIALRDSGGLVENITQHRKVIETCSEGERGRVEALHRFLEFIEAEIEEQGIHKGLFLILEKMHEKINMDLESRLFEDMLLESARSFGNNINGFIRSLFLEPYETGGIPAAEKVSVLTFHASKGQEFPVVFIAAAEETITPLCRKDCDLEEERRLFYVAMTRAKKRLFISHAASRDMFGERMQNAPSGFLSEIQGKYVTSVILPGKRKQLQQPSLF